MTVLLKKIYPIALTALLSFGLMSCNAQEEQKQESKGDPGKNRTAVVETTKGTFQFTLHEDKTPITTKNFIDLTNKGFYNGLKFHRYVEGFVIQGGDPKGDGTGGSDKTIPLEIDKSLSHIEGAVGMARSQDPNSASSQFYVTLAPAQHLDSGYSVFGQVTEGMDVVKQLRIGDKMNKITIIDKVKK